MPLNSSIGLTETKLRAASFNETSVTRVNTAFDLLETVTPEGAHSELVEAKESLRTAIGLGGRMLDGLGTAMHELDTYRNTLGPS